MREESQLDDMRAAIRGDFERLAARLGGQELMQEPAAEPEPEPGPEPELADEPPELDRDSSQEEPPRRSLLARLLGV